MWPLLLNPCGIFKSGEGVGGRRGREEEGLGGKEAKSGRRKKVRKKSTKEGKKNVFKGICSSNPEAMTPSI